MTDHAPNSPAAIELLSWSDVSSAIDQLLDRSQREFVCFDRDLSLQGWDTKARFEHLRDAIVGRGVNVRIALLDTQQVASRFPRLLALLKSHGHKFAIMRSRIQPQPASGLVVADRQHSLFRPVLVQSQGKLIFENSSKSNTYANEFEVIWQQGGVRVFPEAFGL